MNNHLSPQIIEHIKNHLHDPLTANIAGLNRLIEFQPSFLVYMYAQFNFPKT